MKKIVGIVFTLLACATILQAQTATNKIDSTGNVGIGTLSPAEKLHVAGFQRISASTSNTIGDILIFNHQYNPSNSGGQGITFRPYNPSFNGGAFDWTRDLAFDVTNNKWRVEGGFNISGGNVGIGTTSPSEKLHVNGRVLSKTFRSYSDNTEYHHFIRNGTGSAVYINQVSTDANFPILRLSSGTPNPNANVKFTVENNGNVGIGTTSPDEKLTVKGKIHAEEVKVDLSVPGPDYVFEEDYDLTSLKDLETFIKAHKHLPEIPSAKEMEANGIILGEMNMLLLKKIEELTLHTIAQEKALDARHKMLEEERATNNIQQGTLNSQQQQLQVQQEIIDGLIKRIQKLETKGDK